MKPLAPNSLIQNRYLIVHLIGKGGMGEVYLAVDQRLGSAVALKRTFFADDEMLGGAFEREARTLARLRHPVLPKVSDHFSENGEQYLVMEHIAGDDLAKRLEGAQKAFPLSWVLFWADQLLDALAYLHSHEPPIIHRDIKPQNLKLTDENHIVLLDFGLSKNTGQTRTSGSSGSTGSVVGYTPHYAPMEQIRGTGTNPRSDIYSLSATLYQLMTNTVPADALTRADALLNGSADPISPLNEINPEVPREVSDVILHGMEVSQEKRYAKAKEMQKALRKAFSHMQEAMSAQTIAFASPASDNSSRIEQPVGVDHTSSPEPYTDLDSQATKIREEHAAEPESPVPAFVSPTQEATVQYNGPVEGSLKQADIKTEVYEAGSAGFFDDGKPAAASSVPEAAPLAADEWEVADAGDFSPDATTPNIGFDASTPPSPFTAPDNIQPDAPANQNAFATRVSASSEPAPAGHQQSAPSAVKKKSSKAVWAIGGLAALFILAIVTLGAGWFVYSNYYAVAAPEPTPAPTLEIAPTPEPTMEVLTDTNANTSTAGLDTNSNSNSEVPTTEPTLAPQSDTANRDTTIPATRPQQETRRIPKNTPGQPGTKPTPKKPDRTVILQ